MKELKEKGYYIMQDGTKSTDHEIPGMKKKAGKSIKRVATKKRTSHDENKLKKEAAAAALSNKKNPKSKANAKKSLDLPNADVELDNEDDDEEESN